MSTKTTCWAGGIAQLLKARLTTKNIRLHAPYSLNFTSLWLSIGFVSVTTLRIGINQGVLAL